MLGWSPPLTVKPRLFVFYIDNKSQVIEEGPVIQIDRPNKGWWITEADLVPNCIWVTESTIFYLCGYHNDEHRYPCLVVVRLGAEVVQMDFWPDSPGAV